MSTAFTLHHGDCLDVLRTLPDNSADSVVCDPPYGLKLMGRKWDYDVPSVEVWAECLRVLKPGGYLLAFAGTRTQHRMAVRIEDAGFEIRDMIAWTYSGFPKSRNLANDMDSDDASKWKGWGTALKPSLEPITVARKPLSCSSIAANVLAWGTGALNIDGCRIPTTDSLRGGSQTPAAKAKADALGRWPANMLHDGSDEVTDLLGSAARFYYCTKASKRDRSEGCDHLPKPAGSVREVRGAQHTRKTELEKNHHPTVKPTELMRYLCRLVTPPGGVVLDPFMGSGSTGKAAMLEGFRFIGIEREAEYAAIAHARISAANDNHPQLDLLKVSQQV